MHNADSKAQYAETAALYVDESVSVNPHESRVQQQEDRKVSRRASIESGALKSARSRTSGCLRLDRDEMLFANMAYRKEKIFHF